MNAVGCHWPAGPGAGERWCLSRRPSDGGAGRSGFAAGIVKFVSYLVVSSFSSLFLSLSLSLFN